MSKDGMGGKLEEILEKLHLDLRDNETRALYDVDKVKFHDNFIEIAAQSLKQLFLDIVNASYVTYNRGGSGEFTELKADILRKKLEAL